MGPVCRGRKHSGRCSTSVRCTRLLPTHSYRQNLLSSLRKIERRSTLQSVPSLHQSSRACWCRGVSGKLTRGTRDMSLAASRRFPMALGDTAGATCAWSSSLDDVQAAIAACTMRQS